MRPRNHARRPRYALPFGLNLSDYDFTPTREEVLLDRCRQWIELWAKEDDLRREQRAAQIRAEIEADRRKQMSAEAREQVRLERAAQLARERSYWTKQREKDSAAMDKLIAKYSDELDGGFRKKILAKIAEVERDVRRDKAKAEKEVLARRGVIRGRRK